MAVRISLPLCLCFLFARHATADENCAINPPGGQYDDTAQVRYIHDGDTLQLRDGRKIRLIGINTPELARPHKAAEPYATEAKNTLKQLFKKNKSISLIYGKDNKDRYGRTLAHGFSANGQNIQAALLTQGLARAISLPPNVNYAACYQKLETKARCNNIGLWKNTEILDARQLRKPQTGFQLVQGRVKNITINKKGIWLTIDNTLTVGIRPQNQQLFDINTIKNMQNQKITVRGWLNNSNKSTPFYIRIRHPSAIQLNSDLTCS